MGMAQNSLVSVDLEYWLRLSSASYKMTEAVRTEPKSMKNSLIVAQDRVKEADFLGFKVSPSW